MFSHRMSIHSKNNQAQIQKPVKTEKQKFLNHTYSSSPKQERDEEKLKIEIALFLTALSTSIKPKKEKRKFQKL